MKYDDIYVTMKTIVPVKILNLPKHFTTKLYFFLNYILFLTSYFKIIILWKILSTVSKIITYRFNRLQILNLCTFWITNCILKLSVMYIFPMKVFTCIPKWSNILYETIFGFVCIIEMYKKFIHLNVRKNIFQIILIISTNLIKLNHYDQQWN